MANPRTIARLEARILERAAMCLQGEVSDPRASFITALTVDAPALFMAFAICRSTNRRYFGYLPSLSAFDPHAPIVSGPSWL
jgi:hypothetical protein